MFCTRREFFEATLGSVRVGLQIAFREQRIEVNEIVGAVPAKASTGMKMFTSPEPLPLLREASMMTWLSP